MLTEKRRKWLLGSALALTLAAVAWVRVNDTSAPTVEDSQKSAQRTTASGNGDTARSRPQQNSSRSVQLDQLQREPVPVVGVENVFAPKSWYVPPPPPPPSRPVPPPPPMAPPLPFTYVGKLVEEGKTTVFLATPDRNFMVREGDIINGTYRVDQLKAPVMILTYLPLNLKQTLQIGEAN